MVICNRQIHNAIKKPAYAAGFSVYSFISFLRSVTLPLSSCRVSTYKPAGSEEVFIVLLLPSWVIATLPTASVSFI